MKLSYISGLVAIITLALIGLIAVQYFWIHNSYDVKKEQFEQSVYASLNRVSEDISDYEILVAMREEDMPFPFRGGNVRRTNKADLDTIINRSRDRAASLLSPSENGLVNQLLIRMGAIDKGIYYLADKQQWRVWYYIINVWRETGWQTIIFMATLTGIDPGIYEAASIDGAGRWQKMWYVTFPALGNTIITVLILNLAKIMNLFESVFVLQNDSVRRATNVLQTYVYYQTFNSGASADYGYTTAVGLFRSLVGLGLMLICNYASKKVRGRGIV